MAKVSKYEDITYLRTNKEGMIDIITYRRRKPKESLRQFVARKAFGDVSKQFKGVRGKALREGRLMPKNAYYVGKSFSEIMSDEEKVNEYIEKFKAKAKKRRKTGKR